MIRLDRKLPYDMRSSIRLARAQGFRRSRVSGHYDVRTKFPGALRLAVAQEAKQWSSPGEVAASGTDADCDRPRGRRAAGC